MLESGKQELGDGWKNIINRLPLCSPAHFGFRTAAMFDNGDQGGPLP
jgi:hypothetical protein